jgi:hypothetical protein
MFPLTKLITTVVSEEEYNKPVMCGFRHQPIYSSKTKEETNSLVFLFVQSLIEDYRMEPMNFKPGKCCKKYELKYHYFRLKVYIAKSEYDQYRVHFELKYNAKELYGNTIDRLVVNEVYNMYDELHTSLLFV